ncbi:hypothetical protein HKW98_06630 [Stutzerimonas urumqiensis]|uniref:hypothetical protein n=1 Tax=Stutzerimonas urumqiensis TaxID=638269 RepID=UPI003BA899C8
MKTNWQTILGGVTLAATMAISAPVMAEAEFDEWDADNSGVLNFSEWDAGFNDENLMTGWDSDKDGMLSNDEYSQGIYNSYDADGSGDWNEEEYNGFADDSGDGGVLDV